MAQEQSCLVLETTPSVLGVQTHLGHGSLHQKTHPARPTWCGRWETPPTMVSWCTGLQVGHADSKYHALNIVHELIGCELFRESKINHSALMRNSLFSTKFDTCFVNPSSACLSYSLHMFQSKKQNVSLFSCETLGMFQNCLPRQLMHDCMLPSNCWQGLKK